MIGAVSSAGVTIFASRKNNEASVLKAVDERINAQFARMEAEITRISAEHENCQRDLRELRGSINQLMSGPIPPYVNPKRPRPRS